MQQPSRQQNRGLAVPRIRTIKPEFFRSPDIAQLDFPARLLFQAMWCWADDFGIGETNFNGLLGFAFPDEDNFTAQDLRTFCAELAQKVRVDFYTVRGRHYYAIPSWEKHQRIEKRSDRRRNPTPDDPEAVPDQRIPGCAEFAQILRGNFGADSALEQGNRGTGEQTLSYVTEVCHQGDDPEPPMTCNRHKGKVNAPSCGGCADARHQHAQWKTRQELAKRHAREVAKNCPDCGGTNLIEVDDGVVKKCDHRQEVS